MMIAAIVIASIAAWLSIGLAAGFPMARRTYLYTSKLRIPRLLAGIQASARAKPARC